MPVFIIALLAALLAGGSVTAVANNAKPGDALYGYKLAVNETVQTALAGSDANKAKVETQLANQRLSEAESVAANGTLTPALQKQIQTNFQSHVDEAKKLVTALQAKNDVQDASGVTTDLTAALNAHAQILNQLSTTAEPAEQQPLTDLKSAVNSESEKAQSLDASVSQDVSQQSSPDVQTAAQGRETAAQNKIEEAQKYLDAVNAKIGADVAAKVAAQLDVAKKSLADGQAKIQAQAFADAFNLFSDAQSQAQAAQEMARAKSDLNVNIDLEEQTETGTEAQQETTEGQAEQQKQQTEQQKQETEKQTEQQKQEQEKQQEQQKQQTEQQQPEGQDGGSAQTDVQAKVGSDN